MQCLKKVLRIFPKTCQYYNERSLVHKRLALTIQNIICRSKHNSGIETEIEEDDEEEKELYAQIANQYLGIVSTGHRVFVVQPYIKWGRDKKRNTTPQLQLAEAIALVKTLPNWTVVGQKCVPLLTLQRNTLMGSGALETLKKDIRDSGPVTALFVSTNQLKFRQLAELGKAINLPIFDRYTIVIHIFRLHAMSPEAKLQVSLAEIPYIRRKMIDLTGQQSGRIRLDDRAKRFLEIRETKFKNQLNRLKMHRQTIRSQREGYGFPTIAVVGYTNAGKTSLIKALTGDATLEPQNKLFATLDTTVHQGILSNRLKVLYIDTIGFIQDVPETLIEPFKVTLEDAMIADIIVHVFDVSHPDMQAQVQHVQEVIGLMVDENKVIINVANKCDIVEDDSIPEDALAVSAVKSIGIDLLKSEVEQKVLESTRLIQQRFRVEAGSATASWLYKEATVTNVEIDEKNPQYMFLDVIMTTDTFYKFKRFLKQ